MANYTELKAEAEKNGSASGIIEEGLFKGEKIIVTTPISVGNVLVAIQKYAKNNGRTWKSKLRSYWSRSKNSSVDEIHSDLTLLQAARNIYGPSGLDELTFEGFPKYTLSEVKELNKSKGGHFFDFKTLKFFGESMRNFSISQYDGKVFVIRKGGKAGSATFEFNTETYDIRKTDE